MATDAPKPSNVGSNPWAELLMYDQWKTLELKWLPSSSGMTDDQIKATLQLLADSGERLRPRFMMINALDFHRGFSDEVNAWRTANIIPAYNRAGIQRFALVPAKGYPGQTVETGAEPAAEEGANFPTAWFSTLENAYKWLAS
jgi:hypothetical protein